MARNNELKDWEQRLNVAHNKFKVVEPKIDRAWNYYRGKQWDTGNWSIEAYRDKPVDNMVFSNIRAIVPRLNFRNPKIYVRPKKKPFRTKDGWFDTLSASASLEIILNYYYQELQIKREARKCLYDSLLSPFGIMELGYSLKTEKIKDEEEVEVNELIEEDSPYCMRRAPSDFRSDPEGTDPQMNDARWIALRWVKSLGDVKGDPKYSNTTSLKCNYKVKTDFNTANIRNREEVNENEELGLWGRVEGWTIWDKRTRRIMDIVQGHDKFIRNEKSWPLDLDGFPVEILYFNENSGDNYPIPDTWNYLDMQDELNRISSMQLDHIRRISQRRYLTRENALEEEQMRKLTYGGDGTIAISKMALADSLVPVQDATISQDIYMIRNGLKQTIREMAGVSGSEALVAQKFDQATEPALIEQASQSLRGDQQAKFEDFLVRIVSKLAEIIQQTTDEITIPLTADQMNDKEMQALLQNKLVKIDSLEGAITLMPWLEVKKNDIDTDCIVEIEIGSTMPQNEQQQKSEAVSLYQLLAQNPYIRAREGTKSLLETFGKVDAEKMLKSEEEVQQLAMANAKAQLESQIAVDAPKRQTDLAKTQIKSQTTKEVQAMKMHGDMAQQKMDENAHRLEMLKKMDEHALTMRHTQDDHAMKAKGNLVDLVSKMGMSDIKLSEAKEKAKINLQTALKKRDKPDASV